MIVSGKPMSLRSKSYSPAWKCAEAPATESLVCTSCPGVVVRRKVLLISGEQVPALAGLRILERQLTSTKMLAPDSLFTSWDIPRGCIRMGRM